MTIKSLHQATISFINNMPIGSTFKTKTFITALRLFREELNSQGHMNSKGRKISPYQTYGNDNKTLTALMTIGIVERISHGNYVVTAHTKPGFSRYMLEALGHGRTTRERFEYIDGRWISTVTTITEAQINKFKNYIIK
jgi:alpha-beta hydrolase superfamily lysophospholipase